MLVPLKVQSVVQLVAMQLPQLCHVPTEHESQEIDAMIERSIDVCDRIFDKLELDADAIALLRSANVRHTDWLELKAKRLSKTEVPKPWVVRSINRRSKRRFINAPRKRTLVPLPKGAFSPGVAVKN